MPATDNHSTMPLLFVIVNISDNERKNAMLTGVWKAHCIYMQGVDKTRRFEILTSIISFFEELILKVYYVAA